jgi:hypothetical protein
MVLAAEISTESLDTANLQPMVETTLHELEHAGVAETPDMVLADAGYWKNDAIETMLLQGSATLVAPDVDRRKEPRPGRAAVVTTSPGAFARSTGARSSSFDAKASSNRSSAR